MKNYFAYINNCTDSRDDEVIKIQAESKGIAIDFAKDYCWARGNVSLGTVMTQKQLKKNYPDWHALLWGTKPIEPGKIYNPSVE